MWPVDIMRPAATAWKSVSGVVHAVPSTDRAEEPIVRLWLELAEVGLDRVHRAVVLSPANVPRGRLHECAGERANGAVGDCDY